MYKYDSRAIACGDTFICLPGGEPYCDDAKKRGASEVLHISRKEMAELGHVYFGRPSDQLVVIGVTGTNGKTSVCHFVAEAIRRLGGDPFVQGTLTHRLTTPESLDTQAQMAEHVKNGGTHFVMEVSSHGIDQGRVLSISFDIKCLTNISQDHLDYHGSMDAYRAVKYHFMNTYPGKALFSEQLDSDFISLDESTLNGFNHVNVNTAAHILLECGYDPKDVVHVLKNIDPPKGRFEYIKSKAPFDVVIDYAHTPAGLDNVLKEAGKRASNQDGHVVVCFGCGGNRDVGKRSKMGAVGARYAARLVLTQDNSRDEDPDTIIQGILQGIPSSQTVHVEKDRYKAIEYALSQALPNDVVVIAGKGHETSQVIAGQSFPFDDAIVAKEILTKMRF